MLLVIDTSSQTGSIAIFESSKLLFQMQFANTHSNSQFLSLHIANALKVLSKNFQDITEICVVDGPGSFTGLRIGFAYAKGLYFSLNKKPILYKISSLYAPYYFFKTLYKSQSSFYSAISIKKNFSICAEITLNSPLFDYFVLESKINDLKKDIPIICSQEILNNTTLQNSFIPFYNLSPIIATNIGLLIAKKEIDFLPVQVEKFNPTYYKLSQAEENKKNIMH